MGLAGKGGLESGGGGPAASVLASDGAVATPSITFAADQNTGLYRIGADEIGITVGGTLVFSINTSGTKISSTRYVEFGGDTSARWAYNGSLGAISTAGNINFSGNLYGLANSSIRLEPATSPVRWQSHCDIQVNTNRLSSVASGTGYTTNYSGQIRRGVLSLTLAKEVWTTAGTSQAITLAVIPAKMRVTSVITDTTAAYTLGGDTVTLEVGVTGTTAGYIASHTVSGATATKGLADADMGTLLTRAAAVQGGHIASWTATTNLVATLGSSVTNLGTGSATSLTTGSTTFYIAVEAFA